MPLLGLLTILILLVSPIVANDKVDLCRLPPLSVHQNNSRSAIFIFVLDTTMPPFMVAQQELLYKLIACEIPIDSRYMLGTLYTHSMLRKKREKNEIDHNMLVPSVDFASTLNNVHKSNDFLYSPSRCNRIRAVASFMNRASFVQDSQVYTHFIFPIDDSTDEFVNDCDPAFIFKQTARNVFRGRGLPNHLYLDILRIGNASVWTQYGERAMFPNWTDQSINEPNVRYLTSDFIGDALTGEARNDVVVYSTNGLERNEMPKSLKQLTHPTTTSTTTTTTPEPTTISTSTITPTTAIPTTVPLTTVTKKKVGLSRRRIMGQREISNNESDQDIVNESSITHEELFNFFDQENITNTNVSDTTLSRARRAIATEPEQKYEVFGYTVPFSMKVFYIIVVCTTAGVVLLVWGGCAIVFYCCYSDDAPRKKKAFEAHQTAKADENALLVDSIPEDSDYEKPSSMMISEHLTRLEEDRLYEEQMKSIEQRGEISIE